MATKTKSAQVANTAVLINGKRNEVSAYRLGDGFAAKWNCANCGKAGAISKARSDSILQAFSQAKARVYRHYERMHEKRTKTSRTK
jgi:hypothetical protein